MASERIEQEKDELLLNVKRDAKRLMEEAVTKKFVHSDSSTVITLCVSVELCISHRLKRRVGGLLSSNSESVIPKLAKFDEAARKLEMECNSVLESKGVINGSMPISPMKVNGFSFSGTQSKYLWIKIALLSKTLARVIGALVLKWKEFYEPDALMADQVLGPTLVWLLDGPCSLDYSKMKTPDDIWNDPTANELVLRHRIYGSNKSSKVAIHPKRKLLTPTKSNPDSLSSTPILAREHVESLHQNSHSSLIFGKNNVCLNLPDYPKPLPGYLAVHRNSENLLLKWTPNAMMSSSTETEKSQYWDQVLTVDLLNVVFLHCHQSGDFGGNVVLIGQDGIQLPPLAFPPGGSMVLFLSCLEQGLSPFGRLDPPIMAADASLTLPRLRKPTQENGKLSNDKKGEESHDYVFRVVAGSTTAAFDKRELRRLLSRNASRPRFKAPWKQPEERRQIGLVQRMHSIKLQRTNSVPARIALELACEKMKHQIVTRAFFGWLAHCRHLKTVRTHLASLVQPALRDDVLPSNVDLGLTCEMWKRLQSDGKIVNKHRVMQYVYHGGVEASLRHEVWPYLLGHYSFNESKQECKKRDTKNILHYDKILEECRSVENFLREKEKDLLSLDGFNDGDTFSSMNNSTVDETDAFESADETTVTTATTTTAVHSTGKPKLIRSLSISTTEDTVIVNTEEDEQAVMEKTLNEINDEEKLKNSETKPANFLKNGESLSVITNMLQNKERLRAIVENASRRGSEVWQGLLSKSSESSSRRRSHSARQDTLSVDSYDSFDLEVNCHTCGKKMIESKSSLSRGNTNGRANGLESARCITCAAKERRRLQNRSKTESDASTILESDMVDFGKIARDGKDVIFHEPSFDRNDDYVVIDGKDPCLRRQMSLSAAGSPLTDDFLKDFALNIHRIDKDVLRCDRNYPYYADANLQKLRNIMICYVWERLEVGYVQGMCDICAPILVILDDEAKAYGCFAKLMDRMGSNFPHGTAMDKRLANINALIQILDPELHEVLQQHNDHSIFYFCYRWFLLDFKRELLYEDVFFVWETIWASDSVASLQFSLFVALALIELYRDIIVDNRMDFSDIIKFFNEMAERHDASAVLDLARNIVRRLQDIMHPSESKIDDDE